MTIDDDSSIYVGGLPYNATEESIRDAFDLYGGIVAVKIVNDRGIGGKCYGFVTFRNPRSAVDAINDMNGRTIDGRVVRVNEVRTRGGRLGFGREPFRRNHEREMNWDRGRDRERDFDLERYHDHDRIRNRSGDHAIDRERGYNHGRDRDRSLEHYMDRDHDEDRNMEEIEQEPSRRHERGFERNHDLDWDHDREIDRVSDQDRDAYRHQDPHAKKRNGSDFSDRRSTDLSSDSSGYFFDQVKEQMDMSTQRLEELKKEIPQIEEMLEDKRKLISDLQKKSQKLEDALTSAKKLSSHRESQLTKLHRCFMQVSDYNERLRISEQEMQSLVDAAMIEVNVGDDGGF